MSRAGLNTIRRVRALLRLSGACAALLTPFPGRGQQWQPAPAALQPQVWTLPSPSEPASAIVWREASDPAQAGQSLSWNLVQPGQEIPVTTAVEAPSTTATAEALHTNPLPAAAEAVPLLQLGPAVPTANQLRKGQSQISAFQLAPLAGSGSGDYSGSTGNQNYAGRLDLGLSELLQLSVFYSNADDPLYAGINGKSSIPYNYWESYGAALRMELLSGRTWKLALAGSLEAWNVGSGGITIFGEGDPGFSPNQFNDSGSKVYTRNLVGSLNLPFSWQATSTLQLTLTPGVSVLPSSQGAGQGGAGSYYGTNVSLAGGAAWNLVPQLTLFGSGLLPLGPGTNSFNSDLVFRRAPILSGGLNWALNPRIGLEATLTNGFGATPATAVLALPSANQLGYMVRFLYNPAAADSPQPDLTPRQRSLALGGLSVNTALVPPDGSNELWTAVDSGGNVFGFYGRSISNIAQLELGKGGWFNGVPQTSLLTDTFTSDGAPQFRVGGKAVMLSPLRGFPVWLAGRVSLGREFPPGSGAGYVFAESILTWEASRSLALNLNPKLAWSGDGTPWGVGLSANLQLGRRFQLMPEANLVSSDFSQSNASLGLRWLASDLLKLDLYVGNAAGLLDIGQLLGLSQARIGGRVILSF